MLLNNLKIKIKETIKETIRETIREIYKEIFSLITYHKLKNKRSIKVNCHTKIFKGYKNKTS